VASAEDEPEPAEAAPAKPRSSRSRSSRSARGAAATRGAAGAHRAADGHGVAARQDEPGPDGQASSVAVAEADTPADPAGGHDSG
jgi:hypothetical protein